MAKIISCNISDKKGEIKHPVDQVKLIENFGIEGEAHAQFGSIRQVSLLGKESIKKMEDLGVKGLCSGKFAENFTTEGIELYSLAIGTRLKIGDTIHEITQIGKKCHAEDGCEIARTVGKCIMPKEGIFTKVIRGGIVKKGDEITIIS